MRSLLVFLLWNGIQFCLCRLEAGVTTELVSFSKNTGAQLVGMTRSAYRGTELEIRLHCSGSQSFKYQLEYKIRSSPCDKEFIETLAMNDDKSRADWLTFYYNNPELIPAPFSYTGLKEYESTSTIIFNCESSRIVDRDAKDKDNWIQQTVHPMTAAIPVEEDDSAATDAPAAQIRRKRAAVKPTSVSAKSDNSTSQEKSKPSVHRGDDRTWNPAVTIELDAIYLFIAKLTPHKDNEKLKENYNVSVEVEVHWKASYGYLSAIDWPLLPFYGCMCAVYAIYAITWFLLSACQWQDLLQIQFWIGAVIVLGMIEKAVFLAEYQTMNTTGVSVEGAIQFAEIISCIKKTVSRMLVIIVSVGFGTVRPRLGTTLHKVVGVGFIYFVLCAIEALSRVTNHHHENQKQKQAVALPLTLLEIGICWWIFSSLLATTRALRLRRNEAKLGLYRHFTNALIFSVLGSVGFMAWSLAMHVFPTCLVDWKELWVDTAFWHLLFSVVLLVIMILWRPSSNNRRYAFTPLIEGMDGSEDDDEEDTVFNAENFTDADQMTLKQIKGSASPNEKGAQRDKKALEEALRWAEENIPNVTNLADRVLPALADSDEEREKVQLELSKKE